MGFLQDIRNLQEQAEGLAPPERPSARDRVGSATIRAIRDTGITVGDDPTVDLDLTVRLGDGASYSLTHRQTVSRLALPSLQPGATVPVRVDPAGRTSLTIG
jgi:hypothetical protein